MYVVAMFQVALMFVEGHVPNSLRQCHAGGTLIGTGKDHKPLDEDAWSIVMGVFWSRLAAKLTLVSESDGLRR